MAKKNNKTNHKQNHKRYNGPYQSNKNYDFDSIKKNMEINVDGPTADMRLYNDSTISQSVNDNQYSREPRRPKSFKNRAKSWVEEHWFEGLMGVIATSVITGVGIIVYNHSNDIVSIEKDVEYMKEFKEECKRDIDEIGNKVIENTTNIKLIQQKLESSKEK